LKVFVVPHSHCDPGWWKSFEEYHSSWGEHIIQSVVDSLLEDERRRFIWTEICFFEKWWSNQKESKRMQVRELAKQGRLEFVGGGWVSADEACTDLYGIVEQLFTGQQWLFSNVGVKPSIGWSIDPFGHSPLFPWLYSEAGFDAIVINRVHQHTKNEFRQNKQLEFVWRQNWEHYKEEGEAKYDMMTHMLAYPLYDIPNTCGPDWHVCASFDFERPVSIPSIHLLHLLFLKICYSYTSECEEESIGSAGSIQKESLSFPTQQSSNSSR
jgi:hypothetical protein